MPSFVLIRPTVWPQYTNVTDRQDRQTGQRTDSIGRTVLQTIAKNLKPGLVVSFDIRPIVVSALHKFVTYLNPFHTTDSDPTKLFCRVGVGGVNRVGDSFQQFSVVFNILVTDQFCRVWSAV